MLYFIILFVLIFFIGLSCYTYYLDKKYYREELKGFRFFLWRFSSGIILISVIFIIIFFIIFFIMSTILVNAYIVSDAEKVQNQELYKSLVYKVETESIRDDFGIINKEYVDEVQEWNTTLVHNQKLSNNFWIGIFYPDWYNDLKTIDLNKIEMITE